MKLRIPPLLLSLLLIAGSLPIHAAEESDALSFILQKRVEREGGAGFDVVQYRERWDPKKTALVICDMWDKHWCPSATERVGEMAPRLDAFAGELRERGATIIHAPSGTLGFYKDFAPIQRARNAPRAEPKVPLKSWVHLNEEWEASLPIDDSDEGCDCENDGPYHAWKRQHPAIHIDEERDVMTDSADAFHYMRSRGIENLLVSGVHTNMCVLGRPFSVRQMVRQGMNVALVRDLTDSMYNPESWPYVPHFHGTELVVNHIEKYWAPTLTSDQVLGGQPLSFEKDERPHLVAVIAEAEYRTRHTLPDFLLEHMGDDFRISYVFEDPEDRNSLPLIGLLKDADLVVLSMRRRTLPTEQLEIFKEYIASGKPLVAIRTSSHAFALRDGKPPEGRAQWAEFDAEIIGGNYHNHFRAKSDGEPQTVIATVDEKHPILEGVADKFPSGATLYRNTPLKEGTTLLAVGRHDSESDPEPVAWTNTSPGGGRIFYTSLGHVEDFAHPAFQKMLSNALLWAVGQRVPNGGADLLGLPERPNK